MYLHCEPENDAYFTLHDCFVSKMTFENGVLSVYFDDGFWVLPQHPENNLGETVKTDAARVDFYTLNASAKDVEIFTEKQLNAATTVRTSWALSEFMKVINTGKLRMDFVDKSEEPPVVSYLCCIWTPALWCNINIAVDHTVFFWNTLRPDRKW